MPMIIHNFDALITRYVMLFPDSSRPLFIATTSLGDPIVTIGIGAVIAAFGIAYSHVGLLLAGGMVWLTLGVGSLLKLAFNRARPLTEYAANLRVDTFSFPSGHSSGSMIAYGLIAYIAWHLLPQPWGVITAVLLAFLIIAIGVSRVYLGAHFPSDILAGWLLGASALCVIIFIVKPL